jgi:hypothetical protein
MRGCYPVILRYGMVTRPDKPYRDTRKGWMSWVGGAGSIEYHSGTRNESGRDEMRQLDGAAIPVDPRDGTTGTHTDPRTSQLDHSLRHRLTGRNMLPGTLQSASYLLQLESRTKESWSHGESWTLWTQRSNCYWESVILHFLSPSKWMQGLVLHWRTASVVLWSEFLATYVPSSISGATSRYPLSAKVGKSGGRSVRIVGSRTKATEFNFFILPWRMQFT